MGHGGSAAAPLAKELIEAYFSYGVDEKEEPQASLAVPSHKMTKKRTRLHG